MRVHSWAPLAYCCLALGMVLIMTPQRVHGIAFRLRSGETKCLGEEIRDGVLVHGTVGTVDVGAGDKAENIESTSPMQLHFQIQDRDANVMFDVPDVGTKPVPYTFTAHAAANIPENDEEAGQQEYRFCFTDKPREGASPPPTDLGREVFFTMEFGQELDWEKIAKKEHLDPLHLHLRQLEETAKTVNDNFDVAKNREMGHRDTNESTNARVAWISGLSLAVVVALAVMQLVYFRNFFHSKKLI